MSWYPRGLPAPEQVRSVSELVSELRHWLEASFDGVWVAGEVSNFTQSRNQHWYFTLKEGETAQLRAVMYRGNNLRCRFTPRDGMEVLAFGQISVYEPRGEMQLQVLRLEPVGVGEAERRRRELLEKLRAKGYLDAGRKRRLPPYPQRVGVVTSVRGAAIRDILEQFAWRWPLVEVVVRHSAVQGEGAAEELAAALDDLGRLHQSGRWPLDLIILARGGGSSEDLAAFDTETVVEAIVRSPVPVISAVGHEIDVTITDLVADLRAETPSAAVHKAVPDRTEKLRWLSDVQRRLRHLTMGFLQDARQQFQQVRGRSGWQQPLRLLATEQQRLDEWSARMSAAIRRRFLRLRELCQTQSLRLQTLSPRQVLRRGYSISMTEDGRLLRQADSLRPGQPVLTCLAEGAFRSAVLETESTGNYLPPVPAEER